jgi:hypothetical protein
MTTTASPMEGTGIGAATGMTLYGLVVVVFSLLDHEDKVLPGENWQIAVVLVLATVLGALVGAGFDRARK